MGIVVGIAVDRSPFIGAIAIMIGKIRLCSRFIAEAIEDANPNSQEALRAIGAGRV